MLKQVLKKLKGKPKPVLKAKPNKDRPSKEALLEFLEKDDRGEKYIKMKGKEKVSLIMTRGSNLTRWGGICLYTTIQILKYLMNKNSLRLSKNSQSEFLDSL